MDPPWLILLYMSVLVTFFLFVPCILCMCHQLLFRPLKYSQTCAQPVIMRCVRPSPLTLLTLLSTLLLLCSFALRNIKKVDTLSLGWMMVKVPMLESSTVNLDLRFSFHAASPNHFASHCMLSMDTLTERRIEGKYSPGYPRLALRLCTANQNSVFLFLNFLFFSRPTRNCIKKRNDYHSEGNDYLVGGT